MSKIFGPENDTVLYVQYDASNEKDSANLIAATYNKFQQIDIVIAAAEITGPARLDDERAKHINLYQVNALAPFQLGESAVPYLKSSSIARVIYISSLAALHPANTNAGYAANKAMPVRYTSRTRNHNNSIAWENRRHFESL